MSQHLFIYCSFNFSKCPTKKQNEEHTQPTGIIHPSDAQLECVWLNYLKKHSHLHIAYLLVEVGGVSWASFKPGSPHCKLICLQCLRKMCYDFKRSELRYSRYSQSNGPKIPIEIYGRTFESCIKLTKLLQHRHVTYHNTQDNKGEKVTCTQMKSR